MKHKVFVAHVFFAIVSFLICPNNIFAQKLKVSCVGNSITYGYDLPSPSTQSYPAQLQSLLGTTSWSVGNFGISSRTMLKNGDVPYWKEQIFTDAKAYLPNYVAIELGTNDSKTWNWNNRGNEFVSNYKEMIQNFQDLSSKPDVWIGLIPPGQNLSWGISLKIVRDSVNARIKQVALESGVGLIDMYDALGGNNIPWYNSTNFQPDSIHPTTAGAAIIAQKIKEMLLMPKPEVICVNDKIIAPEGIDFQWYFNGKPIGKDKGGKLKEFYASESGKYKVSVKLSANNETRIVSKELYVSVINGTNLITSKSSLKNMALSDGQMNEGDTIRLFTPDTSDKQRWEILNPGNGYHLFRNIYSKKYLTPGENKEGSLVVQSDMNESDNQQWEITRTLGGYCTIRNKKNGLYMTVQNNSSVNGETVTLETQNDADSQLFAVRKNESIASPFSGKKTDVPGIIEAENFDNGGEGSAYHSSSLVNSFGYYRPVEALPIDTVVGANGYFVQGLTKGDWIQYTINVTNVNKLIFDFKLLCIDNAKCHLEVDGVDETGILEFVSSNFNWVSVKSSLKLGLGSHVVRFCVDKGVVSMDKIVVSKDIEGTFHMTSAISGKNLSILGNRITLGASAAQYVPSANLSQQWILSYVSDGFYKIVNKKSALALDASTTNITQKTYTGSAYQLWNFLVKPDGYMYIINKSNGNSLSILKNSTADEATFTLTATNDNSFFLTQAPSVQLPWNNQIAAIPGIIEAENYDQGGESVAYHELDAVFSNNLFRAGDAVDLEYSSWCDFNIFSFKPGEWLNYSVVADSTAKYNFDFLVSKTSNSSFQLSVDGVIRDTLIVNSTGGGQVWTKSTPAFYITKGNHILQIKLLSGAATFDKVSISYSDPTAVEEIKQSELKIFPNPASDLLYLNQGSLSVSEYCITDLTGRVLLSGQLKEKDAINISLLQKGNFILKIGKDKFKFIKSM